MHYRRQGHCEEAGIKRALSQAAAETYVLASAKKLSAASTYSVVELSQITGIITEPGVADELVASYVGFGIPLLRA